jgi:hypothetical protein
LLQSLENSGAKIGIPLAPHFSSLAVSRGNMIPYKGYVICGKAVRVHPNTPQLWRSQGGVFTKIGKGSSNIKHLDAGFVFESKEAAEAHGLELCKKWVDQNLETSDDV